MKKGMGMGGLVLIGLLAWVLTQKKPAQAAELLPGATYNEPSEYELLHKVVPITKYVTKEIPAFTSFEQYTEVTNGS